MKIQTMTVPGLPGLPGISGLLTDLREIQLHREIPLLGGADGTLRTEHGVGLLRLASDTWTLIGGQDLSCLSLNPPPLHPLHQREHDLGFLLTGCALRLTPGHAFVKFTTLDRTRGREFASGRLVTPSGTVDADWLDRDDQGEVSAPDAGLHFLIDYPSGQVKRR